jgi:putative oxidoreductase
METMYTFSNTDGSWFSLILRVTLGVVMFAHGAQKLLGWYGGNGFAGTMGYFTDAMHLPWLVAFLIIIAESLGSLALIAGFLTRFMGASFIVIMLGAIGMVHWPHGFEFHLLVIAMSAALFLSGGGRWSLDGFIARRLLRTQMRQDDTGGASERG